MKKRLLVLSSMLVILSAYTAIAHFGEENFNFNQSGVYPITQTQAVGYGIALFGALMLIVLFFGGKMSEVTKKTVFLSITGVVSLVTLYLVLTTIHMNIVSATKGPVHWHADYEIWACDKKIGLEYPKFMSNRQGTTAIHSHNDNRIHIEGTLMDLEESSLGVFFQAIGGAISNDAIKIPTNEGLRVFHDGDMCNGISARLYVFVNGNLVTDPPAYRISHYENVPPGDRIKFVFTEKPIGKISPFIGKNDS